MRGWQISGWQIQDSVHGGKSLDNKFSQAQSRIRDNGMFKLKKMKVLYQLLFTCVLPLTLCGQENVKVSGARVTEVGIYTAQVIRTTADTNVVGRKLEGLDEFKLLKSTTNIPARVGTRFGFRYEILGGPTNAPITLKMIGKHPPLKNPKTGKTQTKDTYQLESWIGKTYTSYSLDEDWELVPGPWTFEVWHEGKKLCEQSFFVVPDEKKKISNKTPEATR